MEGVIDHVTRGGQFNGGSNDLLQACYRGGQFHGGRMVYVTEVVSLMKGEWSCYRGGHLFNGGRMVMLERWSVLMEGE